MSRTETYGERTTDASRHSNAPRRLTEWPAVLDSRSIWCETCEMRVLGIETSCDETSAAVVEDGYKLLSNVVATSLDLHAQYGGVVPEIAARSHIESINSVIDQALRESLETRVQSSDSLNSKLQTLNSDDLWQQIDAIAVTYGAGLGGSLLIGVLAARTLAIIKKKPLYGINHVEGHVYANFITQATPALAKSYELRAESPKFPLLALIVSGGHSQLVLFRDHFDYTLLGQTHDDAIGEAFDKVAKIIGLPYPGGPSIAKKAIHGDPYAFNFPKAKLTHVSSALAELRSEKKGVRRENDQDKSLRTPPSVLFAPRSDSYDFSFSGVKTAVLRTAQELSGHSYDFPSTKLPSLLSEAQKTDIAASFQRVAVETVVDKTLLAYEEFKPTSVVIAGGVAANRELRRQLTDGLPLSIEYTDPKLCTDNGAMIATLGCYKVMHRRPVSDPFSLDIAPNLSM